VYKVWNKYNRRTPDQGIRRDWICEVVFEDLWFIDANGIVDLYLMGLNIPRSARLSIKSHLVAFVSSRLEHERLYYREKARNRWNGIVDSVAKKYQGIDKLVATPKFIDSTTKEFVANWYLLSREKEREDREEIREAKIGRLYSVTAEEKHMIERRETIEKRHAKEAEKDSEDSKEGGEE
jgi:transcription termination factor NusB